MIDVTNRTGGFGPKGRDQNAFGNKGIYPLRLITQSGRTDFHVKGVPSLRQMVKNGWTDRKSAEFTGLIRGGRFAVRPKRFFQAYKESQKA